MLNLIKINVNVFLDIYFFILSYFENDFSAKLNEHIQNLKFELKL